LFPHPDLKEEAKKIEEKARLLGKRAGERGGGSRAVKMCRLTAEANATATPLRKKAGPAFVHPRLRYGNQGPVKILLTTHGGKKKVRSEKKSTW